MTHTHTHTLYLSVLFVLFTTISSHTATAAQTSNAYDQLPPAVATWAAQAFKGKELAQVKYQKKDLLFSGQVLHIVKAATADKKFLGVAFNKQGVVQFDRGVGMKIAERKARYAVHGALRDDMLQALSTTLADQALPVAIWLNVFEPSMPREQLLADTVLADEVAAATKWYIKQAQAKFLNDWQSTVSAPMNFEAGAPLVHTWLTPAQVYSVAKLPTIARIYLDAAPVHTYSTNWDQAVNATSTGYDGSGFEVCLLEGHKPNTSSETMAGLPGTNAYHCSTGDLTVAARWQAEIVASDSSPYGVASGALTSFGNWVGSSCSSYNSSTAIDWCGSSRGADVWSWPYTCPSATNDLLDYHAKHSPYPTVVVSADNGGSSTVTTCLGYNVLNTGASDHNDTVSRSDDSLWSGTSTGNPGGDLQEPMLCAPGVDIESGSGAPASSTSASTTMVAGAAAQVLHANSDFNQWPEGVRAVLLASANENVDDSVLTALGGTYQEDGIGELNVGIAVDIADSSNSVEPDNSVPMGGQDSGHYFGSIYTSDEYENNEIFYMFSGHPFRAKATAGGSWLRVVFVWDATASCTSADDASTCTSSVPDADFDLWIYDLNDETYYKSESYDNTWETVAIDDADHHRYEIYVTRWEWESGVTSTYAGLAWHFGDYDN